MQANFTVITASGSWLPAAAQVNRAMGSDPALQLAYLDLMGEAWEPLPEFVPQLIEALDESGEHVVLEIVDDEECTTRATPIDDEYSLRDTQPATPAAKRAK